MEFFQKAKYVRLRSQHGKYLCADDGATVSQHRDCAERNAKWKVEIVEGSSLIRLKSCYKCYLTASSILFLLGMAGKKVLQTIPLKLDSSVEWEPIKEGFRVKFKTRNGTYLQANGGLPPWRNSVTHDILHRRPAPSSILWEVEITETVISPSSVELESMPSLTLLPPRPGGRLIYYGVGDGNGNIEKDYAWPSFVFKGRDFYELTQKLEDETGVHDFIVCAYHPLSGKLYPLRSQLPPNNSSMHLVMVQTSSECHKRPKLMAHTKLSEVNHMVNFEGHLSCHVANMHGLSRALENYKYWQEASHNCMHWVSYYCWMRCIANALTVYYANNGIEISVPVKYNIKTTQIYDVLGSCVHCYWWKQS